MLLAHEAEMSGMDPFMLEAEDSDFTEAFDLEPMHDMGSLEAMFPSIGGQAGGSAGQSESSPWWAQAGGPSSLRGSSTSSILSAGSPTDASSPHSGSDSGATCLSPSISLASSEATLWHSQPQPSSRLMQSSSQSWQALQHEWARHEHAAAPAVDRGRALSLAIQKVLQTPRVQLKRQSLPLGLKLDTAAVQQCYTHHMQVANGANPQGL